ncbi:MAG: ATP-binding protein [Myxococcota bacterium]|nr:ATP-binding protein [Myxococcota bacterium]
MAVSDESGAEARKTARESSDRSLLLRGFVLPGACYPACHFLLAPSDALDPALAWLAIGGAFLLVPLIDRWHPLTRPALRGAMSLGGALVTLHLFVLASWNEMQPFYSLGSSIAVLASVLLIPSVRLMIVYSGFVAFLGTLLYLSEPDPLKIAYWGSMLPVLFLAHQRLTLRLAQRREIDRSGQIHVQRPGARTPLDDEPRVAHETEAVGRLAGGVAHEFNNLLTTIGIYAELLLAGLADESPLRKEVGQIQKANREAAALTQQLLTLGQRSHAQIDLIDLNEVVSDAESTLRDLLSNDTKLEFQLTPDSQMVWGNADQVKQILINVATNAQDAITGPGLFRVETSRCSVRTLAERGFAGTAASNAYVLLRMSDSGAGMDSEVQSRALDPFFTTKPRKQGAGLGLSIAQGIVKQADGHLHLQSEPGEGTHVELYWPLANSKTGDPTES